MCKIAMTFAEAADIAAVNEDDIIQAIKRGDLLARVVRGSRGVVLASDIQAWIEKMPAWSARSSNLRAVED